MYEKMNFRDALQYARDALDEFFDWSSADIRMVYENGAWDIGIYAVAVNGKINTRTCNLTVGVCGGVTIE